MARACDSTHPAPASVARPGVRTLIATHEGADFDALAAQVAARKLYPGAEFLLSPSVGRDVHPYLALHRDFFGGSTPEQIDWSGIGRLVIVDVRRRSRLGHVGVLLDRYRADPASLELVLYDHHPARADDLHGDLECIEPVGSTTTLLVERLEAAGLQLDPIEATLLALGLHADTGSFSFNTTTSRDARALAFLLAAGADGRVLTRYLHAPLDSVRRQLIARILDTVDVRVFGGLRIGIATVDASRRLNGLDEVTTRAHELSGCAVLLVLYQLGSSKLQVIGRSHSPALDLGAILAEWGGGGQREAAAVTRRGTTAERAKEQLLEVLSRQPAGAVTARDLMSSPVHTVATGTRLREIALRLAEWGHRGTIVLRDGVAVAAISRSDLLRAERRGDLDFPVESCMSPRLFTIAPDAPLEQLMGALEEHDVGRLPVLEEGRLIGIVSRSDVLRALYGEVPGRAAPPLSSG